MSNRRPPKAVETARSRRSGGCISYLLLAVVIGGLAILVAFFSPYGVKPVSSDLNSSAKVLDEKKGAKYAEKPDEALSNETDLGLGFQSSASAAEVAVAYVEEAGGDGQIEELIDTAGQGGASEGFSDMDSMLHWAIGNSDPEKLGVAAKEAKRMSSEELEKRSIELKELMDALRMPSDADLMKIALADLRNASTLVEDRRRALHELLELVVPIDNANVTAFCGNLFKYRLLRHATGLAWMLDGAHNGSDLDKLGGLETVIEELQRSEAELRTLASWVLGQAAQNNPTVQLRLLEVGVMRQLIQKVIYDFQEEEGGSDEEHVKAMYAIAAIVRNQPKAQEAFFNEDGGAVLIHQLLVDESRSTVLRRKAVALIGDLAEQQSGHELSRGFFLNRAFLQSLLGLVLNSDLDLREKTLMTLQSVGGTGETVVTMLMDDCMAMHFLEKLEKDLAADYWDDSEKFEFVQDLAKLNKETIAFLSRSRSSARTALA